MLLKKGSNIKYGLPYMGSKSKVIESIARYFPNADHFYDLFGGGFSVTHYMCMHRSKSYKEFHYNEIRPGMCEFIKDCIDGKYNYDNFKPEWVSREDFFKYKDSNPYIKIIWSFGNNGRTYLFGKDIEQQKRSMHQAVVFNEFDSFMKEVFKIDKWPNDLTITGKRLYLKKLRSYKIQLEQLEQLERLERLEQLEHKKSRINFYNLSYDEVKIKDNSIIYCDIPYKGTADYGSEFNHSKFFDWANSQTNPLFISEYNVDDSRFTLLKTFSHRSTLSATANNKVLERLYCNRAALKYFKK